MSRKVAGKRVDHDPASSVGSVALGMAGGALGAMVGSSLGRTNGSSVAGAAVGSVAGVLLSEAAKPCAARTAEVSGLAGYLRQHLGSTITAYLSGARDLALVDHWVNGATEPEAVEAERLKLACDAAHYLIQAYGDKTARSWFMGSNAVLDSKSPASVLRNGQKPEDWEYVIPAARQVVENAR